VRIDRLMFSLQRFLGKDDKVFSLLEGSAEEGFKSVQALVTLSKNVGKPVGIDAMTNSRRRDKEITQQIRATVYSSFVIALEREDVEALSSALYKIPKVVDKFRERVLLVSDWASAIDFSTQIRLLEQASGIVLEMVRSLRGGMNLDKVRDLNDKLQFLEGEADRHMMVLYKDLFSGKHDAVRALALKDLYELLEKVIDRCRDAGNVVANIVLKNS
jgi:uncharacterized protein